MVRLGSPDIIRHKRSRDSRKFSRSDAEPATQQKADQVRAPRCSRQVFHVFSFLLLSPVLRYTVDSSARLVPVGTAEKWSFSHQLELDNNRGMHFPANVSQELAPFPEIAGVGRVPEAISPNDVGEFTSYTGDRRDHSSSMRASPGKAGAKRAGGRLRPVTVHSTPSRKRTPVLRRYSLNYGKYLRSTTAVAVVMLFWKRWSRRCSLEVKRLVALFTRTVDEDRHQYLFVPCAVISPVHYPGRSYFCLAPLQVRWCNAPL